MPDELTQVMTTPAGAGAAATSVLPSTGRPAAATVDLVLVVRDGSSWLPQCLDAIAAQQVSPSRIVLVDVASSDTSVAIARAHQGVRRVAPPLEVVRLDEPVPLGTAVARGIEALPLVGDASDAWVWVLHEGAAATPSTLARLLTAGLASRSVGIAGPKVVAWDDTRRLVELGIQVTHTGRRLGAPAVGEADQGQYDGREDVLAVPTDGMLVRRSVWNDVGGFDRSFLEHGGALDLGWRTQLAGHRVVVVPTAVVRDAGTRVSSADGHDDTPWVSDGPSTRADGRERAARAERRAMRQVALARCSPLAAPFLAVWVALSAVLLAVTLLLAKRPRLAWRELADVTALLHPVAITGARWRGRRSRRLGRGDLATLFVPAGASVRTAVDRIQDSVLPDRHPELREAAPTTETGPATDESEALGALPASLGRRVLTHPGVLAVTAVLVATAIAWRGALRAGALSPSHTGLAGGELRPVTTDAAGLWHAFRDAWHGAGLGTGVDSGPHLAVLAGLTWLAERLPALDGSRSSAGVTVAWLIVLAPALSAWTAYLAGRVVTTSRVARGIVALAWGTSAVITTATADGRLTLAVGHVLLPLVLAGLTLAARRDGTWTATFATALGAAVLGAFVPPLLVVVLVAALVLLLVGPGMVRGRAVVLLVVPVGLLGPWVTRFADDWRLVLSGPGLVATADGHGSWPLLLTHPGAVTPAVWLLAPVVALGVAGYAVRSRSAAGALGLVAGACLSLVGLAAAFASGRVVLGSAETGIGVSEPAHLWAGVGLELCLAGLLVGVLAGSEPVLAALRGPRRRWSFAASVTVVAVLLAAVVSGAALWAVRGAGSTLTVGQATLPAVAVEQGSGPLANRLLLLRPSPEVVDFVLAGQEPGELLRDLDREPDADDAPLVAAVAELVGGQGADSLDASSLARLGIGFVQVSERSDSTLTRRLDSAEGLSRLGSSSRGILWKVRPLTVAADGEAATAPSRARLVDAAGAQLAVVPTRGPHAAIETELPRGSDGRRLVVAEPAQWADHAVVTLDGQQLTPVSGTDQPTYAVPSAGGDLTVDLAAADPWWRLAQATLLALVVFMAIPFGNRRSRRRS
ncbi:glycosyl transferase family 2 [Humibacillus xanthopallidus]|uniref:Glycosyl transferase family 2 n=1 Tax=Humibacillus xanthopallidus TaxID=412689 RepID=A0A543PS41_9MICO|nr:glycosyltransferase [Humibacillus xanthopallidus]TQN46892.1 glycosyl transferase family 2 [Humibacillus xanthopallidus]